MRNSMKAEEYKVLELKTGIIPLKILQHTFGVFNRLYFARTKCRP